MTAPRIRPRIEILEAADISVAGVLSRAAGWNQLPADWQRFIKQNPEGCFKAVWDQRVVGTVTTTCHGDRLAWIGMMLVDSEYRRRGIGCQLMRHALSHLRSRGIRSIKLDATDAGRSLYERLGFSVQWRWDRWQLSGERSLPKPAQRDDWLSDAAAIEAASPLDRSAFGCARRPWLRSLARDAVTVGCIDGMGMIRPGRMASHLGPIVARGPAMAQQLVSRLLAADGFSRGDVLWDAPGSNLQAGRLANELGFRPVRRLYRMSIGERLRPPQEGYQFAIGDPATG